MEREIRELIKMRALNHYNLMISWVEDFQKSKKPPDPDKMFDAIRQNWFGEFCPYCNYYNQQCKECPLNYGVRFFGAGSDCCNSLWLQMTTAKTWGDWLLFAKKVREFIKKNG